MVTVNGYNYAQGYGRSGWIGPYIPNSVRDILLTTSPAIVTLDEVKADSKIDFNDEDAYITELISLCQGHIEQYCGVSCATRTVQAILCNHQGLIEIPFGPIQTITSIVDENGNDLSGDLVTDGLTFFTIKSPRNTYINITYQAGYATENLPLDLKKALLMEIAFRYRYRIPDQVDRANVNPGLCTEAIVYCNPHRRMRFI